MHDMSRSGRSNADDLAGKHVVHGVVPSVPPASGAIHQDNGQATGFSEQAHELFGMSPMKEDRTWRTLEEAGPVGRQAGTGKSSDQHRGPVVLFGRQGGCALLGGRQAKHAAQNAEKGFTHTRWFQRGDAALYMASNSRWVVPFGPVAARTRLRQQGQAPS